MKLWGNRVIQQVSSDRSSLCTSWERRFPSWHKVILEDVTVKWEKCKYLQRSRLRPGPDGARRCMADTVPVSYSLNRRETRWWEQHRAHCINGDLSHRHYVTYPRSHGEALPDLGSQLESPESQGKAGIKGPRCISCSISLPHSF